ncbi:MAG: AEC family transporter [Beijerinckiaceae bacterium]|jgi:predicted permease|nr:AEC family transporter [Beijerinckiaceae bacterium]
MTALLTSLLSVFAIILVGFAARQTRFIEEGAWRGFEAVTYHVLIPALVIHTLAFVKLDGLPVLRIGGTLVFGAVAMTGLMLALRGPLARHGVEGPAFTSIYQGAVRWNTFIALAVASHQFGNTGVALMAVVIATLIPVVNVMSVLVLSRHARGEPFDLRSTALTLIRNPFIWSCAVGIALNPLASFIPAALGSAIEIIGRGALAAGLLVVGSGLDLRQLQRPTLSHWLASGLKLLMMPALVLAAATVLGLTGAALSVALIAATVPTAAASYIMARQMGGDAPLMAEILSLQTVLAMLTMPIILLIFVM